MKRVKVLGLCLIAVFAFSAVVAASSQAGKYNHGPIKVESVGEGEAELGNSVANIRCKSHTAKSEIVGPNEARNVVSLYKGCEVAGKGIPCGNVGSAEIQTEKLVSKLAWVNKSKSEAGADFKPESGEHLAVFDCKGFAEVKVYGAIIGSIPPADLNTNTSTGKLTFQESGFHNVPQNFEGGPKENLEAEFIFEGVGGTKRVESGQIQVDNTTNHKWKCKEKNGVESCKKEDLAQTNTVSGTPQYGRCEKKGAGTLYTDPACQVAPEPGGKAKYGFVLVPG